jgi:hypothetical protein
VKAISSTGGTLQIHLDNVNNAPMATIKIPKTNDWKEIKVPLTLNPEFTILLFH